MHKHEEHSHKHDHGHECKGHHDHEHSPSENKNFCVSCNSKGCKCNLNGENKKVESETCSCCKEENGLDSEDVPRHHHHNNSFFGKLSNVMGWTEGEHDHDHDHSGHGGHGGHDHDHTFIPKKWILILATILGTLALYHMIAALFLSGPIVDALGNDYVQLTLGTIAFFIMGIAFIKGSVVTITKKEIAEDTLVAIATGSAYIYSVSVFIVNATTGMTLPYFFYEQIEVLWLIYLGRFIEEWLTHKVSREMNSLNDLKPKLATVVRDGKEIEVSASSIKLGDIVIVKTGQLVPVDGIVIEGKTTIDESSLTGESIPINKEVDSTVFGGTVSSSGLIKVKATKILDESFISQIINSVHESMATKPKSQRIADKIASWLIPSVLIIAFASFFITGIVYSVWVSVPSSFTDTAHTTSAWIYAYYILITVLVIACPCSFAMTTPMSVLVGSTVSKKEGALFSSDSLFETIKEVDVICFDKTGTLTEGKFDVIDTNINKEHLIDIVSIEKTSNHPLAKSIVKHYSDLKLKEVKSEEVIGKGLKSDGIMIGSLKWLNEFFKDYKESDELINKRRTGSVIIYAFNDKEVLGFIELKDKIKHDTLETLSQIRKMGIDIVMITGDQKDTAVNIGSQLGIKESNIYSEVSPQDKSSIISKLQKEGKVVAFVGDGINDSVALIQSDIGIAMGEGSDVAIEAADIVLNKGDLSLVAYSIWLSRRTLFTIKRGFGIAIVYNALMVPAAALGILGLTGAGPALAALSMVFNDSIAMINAMSLTGETKKKFDRKYK